MPSTPTPIAQFIAAHKKNKIVLYRGRIDWFAGDDHSIVIDPRKADLLLAGEEVGFDEEIHLPLGMLGDLPVVVDLGKPALAVKVLTDGILKTVAKSFAAFIQGCEPLAAPAPLPDGPKTRTGAKPAKWPKGPALLVKGGAEGTHFLGFAQSDANSDLYYVRMRQGRSVAAKWKKTTLKYHRGTGVWLDVARFGSDITSPAVGFSVTARVKARLEGLQPKGIEFLPFRGNVRGRLGDAFVAHPTRLVACLDSRASRLPPMDVDPDDKMTAVQDLPPKLVLKRGALPSEPCLFRIAEVPHIILASGALVEALRNDGFSGLDFVLPNQTAL